MTKQKLLLHICCAPDATHSVELLREEYDVTGFFYNPCIQPVEEYRLRKKAMSDLAKIIDLDMISDPYDVDRWQDTVKGLEAEPEGGKRCELCYQIRLEKTAEEAAKNNIDFFTTTLTISPHKHADRINAIGEEAGKKYNVSFLPLNLKKKEGFRKSLELSRKYNLYRQNYCGCFYSKRK